MSWRRIPHLCCRGLCSSSLLPSYAKHEINMAAMIFKCQNRSNIHHTLLRSKMAPSIGGVNHNSSRTFFLGCSYHKEFEKTPENNTRDVSNTAPESSSTAENESQQSEKPTFLEARRKGVLGGRRRLSPFQRVKEMMGEHHLSAHKNDSILGEPTGRSNLEMKDGDNLRHDPLAANSEGLEPPVDTIKQGGAHLHASGNVPSFQPPNTQTDVPLIMGEYVVIHKQLERDNMKVLVKLHQASYFDCKWGRIPHSDIIGQAAGQLFKTHRGTSLAIRRPSLEDFVLLMKRGPTILYPKDAYTILMMVDVSPGDIILEAGTGSGAMTLHLSRAVGSSGRVLTFESRTDHHMRAVSNWRKWKASWDISHADHPWPDNVSFHNAMLHECQYGVGDELVDGVSLDLGDPVTAMPIVCKKLKPGKVIAVYVAQITLVVDILNAIRTQGLPLTLETVLEVSHKSWLVKAVNMHDRSKAVSAPSVTSSNHPTKYVCRPEHHQMPHTGFLVKLRKITPGSDENVGDD